MLEQIELPDGYEVIPFFGNYCMNIDGDVKIINKNGDLQSIRSYTSINGAKRVSLYKRSTVYHLDIGLLLLNTFDNLKIARPYDYEIIYVDNDYENINLDNLDYRIKEKKRILKQNKDIVLINRKEKNRQEYIFKEYKEIKLIIGLSSRMISILLDMKVKPLVIGGYEIRYKDDKPRNNYDLEFESNNDLVTNYRKGIVKYEKIKNKLLFFKTPAEYNRYHNTKGSGVPKAVLDIGKVERRTFILYNVKTYLEEKENGLL